MSETGTKQRLLRTASRFGQQRIDQAGRAFLIVGRKEVEAPPEFVPQRNAIEDDPSHRFGALPHMGLLRPWTIFRIGDYPESKIPLPVIDLIDDLITPEYVPAISSGQAGSGMAGIP